MALVAWETAVLGLPDNRPVKAMLLDLAYNTSEELSFSGTSLRANEVELIAAGLPSTRILDTYGVALIALDLSRCNISSKVRWLPMCCLLARLLRVWVALQGVQLLGAALVANDTLRKVCVAESEPEAGVLRYSSCLLPRCG